MWLSQINYQGYYISCSLGKNKLFSLNSPVYQKERRKEFFQNHTPVGKKRKRKKDTEILIEKQVKEKKKNEKRKINRSNSPTDGYIKTI